MKFESRDVAPDAAFEALTGQLFERWCHREHGAELSAFAFVNGAGGDGGVEAYATLSDNSQVGLQAKWFRAPMGQKQFSQIARSVRTAIAVHPRLRQYIVAVPRNLGAEVRVRRKSERQRWTELVTTLTATHANLELILWGESQLEGQLAEPECSGLAKLWFSRTLTHNDLRRSFERATHGWLAKRYIPGVHCAGQIKGHLDLVLQEPQLREQIAARLRKVQPALEDAIRWLARFDELPASSRLADAQHLRDNAIACLQQWQKIHDLILDFISGKTITEWHHRADENALQAILTRLEQRTSSFQFATEPLKDALSQALLAVHALGDTYHQLSPSRQPITLFFGRPGTGKTHGIAHAVESRLERRYPAVLFNGAAMDPKHEWGDNLRSALDLPGWTTTEILNAIEALAIRCDVERIRKGEQTIEQTKALIAIDALDESPNSSLWLERLGEITAGLARYKRLRLVVTAREEIRRSGQAVPEQIEVVSLPLEGDAVLASLIDSYCQVYRIDIRNAPFIRAMIRTPFALRLFAELYKNRTITREERLDLTLNSLLRRKLDEVEVDLVKRNGQIWDVTAGVATRALTAIAKESLSRAELPMARAIEVVRQAQTPIDLLPAAGARQLLLQLTEYGVLNIYRHWPLAGLVAEETVGLSSQVISDYLIAHEAACYGGATFRWSSPAAAGGAEVSF